MQQAENPLDQLRDIHLPEAVDSFALAPGWWVLISLAVAGIGYLVYLKIKKHRALYLLGPAQAELDRIAQLTPNSQAVAELSALFKRVALLYYPKRQVASLNGQKWIQFLEQPLNEPVFNLQQKNLFADFIYQPEKTIEHSDWQSLIANSRVLLDTFIRTHALGKHTYQPVVERPS